MWDVGGKHEYQAKIRYYGINNKPTYDSKTKGYHKKWPHGRVPYIISVIQWNQHLLNQDSVHVWVPASPFTHEGSRYCTNTDRHLRLGYLAKSGYFRPGHSKSAIPFYQCANGSGRSNGTLIWPLL